MGLRLIKTEKHLVRPIRKEMELGGYNADIKKRTLIAKEVCKAVEFGMKNTHPEQIEDMLDAIGGSFLCILMT